MARSHAVYVVVGDDAEPVAGFTVRHELVTWLGRHPEMGKPPFVVWRCGDGLWQSTPRPMDPSEMEK